MRKTFRLSFLILILLFSHVSLVLAQEEQNDVEVENPDNAETFTAETFQVDEMPVMLDNIVIEKRDGTLFFKCHITNLTDVTIQQITTTELIFNKEGKRLPSDVGNYSVDLKPLESKNVVIALSVSFTAHYFNSENRVIVAVNYVLSDNEVWDVGVKEIESAVTSFAKGETTGLINVRYYKFPSL